MPENVATHDSTRTMDEKSWWDLWNTSHRTKDSNDPVSSELFQRIVPVINSITKASTGRVLEVACGAGDVSRLLSYSSYHGLDISPAAIQIAQQKAPKRALSGSGSLPTYEATDFHEWPLALDPFDVVVCVDAIVCFRDQKLVLSKMAAALKPQGHIVITTINPFVYYRIKKVWPNGPVSRWLTRRELHELVTSAGFAIEKSYTIMPRGNLGLLRLLNSGRLDAVLGPSLAARWRRLKEWAGLGQYRVIQARKTVL